MAQAHLTRAAPCFAVADVFSTAEYYRDVLGFSFDRFYGDPPSFVILHRDAARVMLKQVAPEAMPHAAEKRSLLQYDIFFDVNDARAMADELRGRGAEILQEPVDRQIWNGRELIVRDCDGRIVCFAQLLDEHPDQ
jgi:catechol 2,3-dioxygenase-like lactoylglutathione lyase family enzyme